MKVFVVLTVKRNMYLIHAHMRNKEDKNAKEDNEDDGQLTLF